MRYYISLLRCLFCRLLMNQLMCHGLKIILHGLAWFYLVSVTWEAIWQVSVGIFFAEFFMGAFVNGLMLKLTNAILLALL